MSPSNLQDWMDDELLLSLQLHPERSWLPDPAFAHSTRVWRTWFSTVVLPRMTKVVASKM